MADLEQLTKEIEAGDYDGQLGAVFGIVFARAKATETEFAWRIKLSDTDTFDAESVTLQELAFAEKACSTDRKAVSYLDLDPMKSMDHLIALIVAHHVHNGLTVREATMETQKLTASDLGDIVSVYEIKAPKVDAPSTSNGS